MNNKVFSIYIATNKAKTVLYIGVTSDLQKRMVEHRTGTFEGFTKRYHCKYPVYFETVEASYGAILREKELKGWVRRRKDALINSVNPNWNDLYETLW